MTSLSLLTMNTNCVNNDSMSSLLVATLDTIIIREYIHIVLYAKLYVLTMKRVQCMQLNEGTILLASH